MRILVGCERHGRVRDAFLRRGHDAISCDLLPTTAEGPHIIGNVAQLILDGWDMLIAFPPCTYLAASGMHWTTRGFRDPRLTKNALHFVRTLMDAPIKRIAIENPVGVISTQIRKPDQILQPYHFGADASKRTCLWLKNLPRLSKGRIVTGRELPGGPRWENQTDSGQNRLSPDAGRADARAATYNGIAEAMGGQWGWLK